jgi:transcriptional regulator with XRE-family HTH domain
MNFVQLVRQQMKSRGLSIRRVCRMSDVDPSFFAKVLRGERQPPDDERVLARLAASRRRGRPAPPSPTSWSR